MYETILSKEDLNDFDEGRVDKQGIEPAIGNRV
jgi:hypothetical protein